MYCIDKLTSKKSDNKVIWRIKTMNVLTTSQSDIFRVTSLGRPQQVNLNIFNKMAFYGNFSVFSDAKCIPDIAEPNKLKT